MGTRREGEHDCVLPIYALHWHRATFGCLQGTILAKLLSHWWHVSDLDYLGRYRRGIELGTEFETACSLYGVRSTQ